MSEKLTKEEKIKRLKIQINRLVNAEVDLSWKGTVNPELHTGLFGTKKRQREKLDRLLDQLVE